jgi:hypothetical protein
MMTNEVKMKITLASNFFRAISEQLFSELWQDFSVIILFWKPRAVSENIMEQIITKL